MLRARVHVRVHIRMRMCVKRSGTPTSIRYRRLERSKKKNIYTAL